MERVTTQYHISNVFLPIIMLFILLFGHACGTGGDIVHVTTVSNDTFSGLGEEDLAHLAKIKESRNKEKKEIGLENVISGTPNYTINRYLTLFPDANNPVAREYRVGGYDIIDIMVYEEPDLSRANIRISSDGYLSFPFIGRIKVGGLTTSRIEKLIALKLAEGEYILDAHVSVTVVDFMSKKFMALG